jgi:hypothetical protein
MTRKGSRSQRAALPESTHNFCVFSRGGETLKAENAFWFFLIGKRCGYRNEGILYQL